MANEKLVFDDGSIYEGEVVNGKANGKGKMTRVYESEVDVADNTLQGASCTIRQTYVYEGDFVDGKRTGRGKMTYPNGKVEEGVSMGWNDSIEIAEALNKLYPDASIYSMPESEMIEKVIALPGFTRSRKVPSGAIDSIIEQWGLAKWEQSL